MEFTGSDSKKTVTLPTFRKWLTTQSKEVEGTCHVVNFVWFPNLYPNFTLDTDYYRLRISTEGIDQEKMEEQFNEVFELEQVLAVHIDDKKSAGYSLRTLDGESGEWETIGEAGYKFTIHEKKSSKKRTSKKPL